NFVGSAVVAFGVLAVASAPVRAFVTRRGGAAPKAVEPDRRDSQAPITARATTRNEIGHIASTARSALSHAALAHRRTRLIAAALAASVVGLVLIAAHRADGLVRIDVLDVGQGDAVLVQGDHGSRLLIDAGPDPNRLLVALDAHVPAWDRRIDVLIL